MIINAKHINAETYTQCQGHEVKLGKFRNRERVRKISSKAVLKNDKNKNIESFSTYMTVEKKGKKETYQLFGNVKHVNNCKKCNNKIQVTAYEILSDDII